MMLICLAIITFAVWTVAGVCSIIADVQRRNDDAKLQRYEDTRLEPAEIEQLKDELFGLREDEAIQHEQLTAAKKAIKLAASGHCCLICGRDCIGGDVTACSAFEWDGTCGGDE